MTTPDPLARVVAEAIEVLTNVQTELSATGRHSHRIATLIDALNDLAALRAQGVEGSGPPPYVVGEEAGGFREWWRRNVPSGTVISSPDWWAVRIARFFAAPAPAVGGDAKLTNPYTGAPRDYRDVESDPAGVLIVEPGAPLLAAKPADRLPVSWADFWISKGNWQLANDYATFELANQWLDANISAVAAKPSSEAGDECDE